MRCVPTFRAGTDGAPLTQRLKHQFGTGSVPVCEEALRFDEYARNLRGGAPDASLDAANRFLDRGCGEIVVEFEAQREHLARTEMHGVHLVWRPSTQREHARARQRAALGSPGRLKAPASGSRVRICSRLPWKGKEQRWRRSLKGRFWRKAAVEVDVGSHELRSALDRPPLRAPIQPLVKTIAVLSWFLSPDFCHFLCLSNLLGELTWQRVQ